MEPQLYRCGNTDTPAGSNQPHHGFNGAATLSLRKYRYACWIKPATPWLQWSRNFIVAEIPIRLLDQTSHTMASMEPQLYRCGNQDAIERADGPSTGLQWSRNFIVAEIDAGANKIDRRSLLQWSRNFIVAEICIDLASSLQLTQLQWSRNFIVAEIPSVCQHATPLGLHTASMEP